MYEMVAYMDGVVREVYEIMHGRGVKMFDPDP